MISDTGVGISAKKMKNLFEPEIIMKGKRVKAGLGLFSSHNVLQKHGGQIRAESTLNKSTTLTVLLPLDLKEPQRLWERSRA